MRWRATEGEPSLRTVDRPSVAPERWNWRLRQYGPRKRPACNQGCLRGNKWAKWRGWEIRTVHNGFPPKKVIAVSLCALHCMLKLNQFEPLVQSVRPVNQRTEHTIGSVTGPILIKILNRRLRHLAVGLLLWCLAGYYWL